MEVSHEVLYYDGIRYSRMVVVLDIVLLLRQIDRLTCECVGFLWHDKYRGSGGLVAVDLGVVIGKYLTGSQIYVVTVHINDVKRRSFKGDTWV